MKKLYNFLLLLKFQLIKIIFYLNKSEDSAGFLRAARAGNLDKVLEYLNNNIDINVSNSVRNKMSSISFFF